MHEPAHYVRGSEMLHNISALKILDFLDVRSGACTIWLFCVTSQSMSCNGSEVHKRWKVRLLFIAEMFLHVRGSIPHGDDQFSGQFTNGAVKKFTASCFMDSPWRRFAPWKLCQKITADTRQLYAKLFVQDITTQLRSGHPKGDYRETLTLTKFSAYLSAIQVTAALPSLVLTFTLKKILVYLGLSD